MLLYIIKAELTTLLSGYRVLCIGHRIYTKITKFRRKFKTKLDFQSNAVAKKNVIKSDPNNTVRYPGNPT